MFSKRSFISRNINVHIVMKLMKKKKKDERKLLDGEPDLERRRRGGERQRPHNLWLY